ncbi:hypothetical protein TrVE_jg2987 [Triparma verrucosa]|jgi:hypothetical protein|uniref:Growth arrest-specific protein 8 domain-containing protein n=2 Tax=Triparma TaxID=722752 RepID=A0A9W7BD97_9STRA|nr:hypothetical protein TrST_g814 [Triparma strigata]GMI11303.1 hypothetical protein TrVE_jg2987 [Triparma verrucosa]
MPKKGKKGKGAAAPVEDNAEEAERKAMIKMASVCANQTKKEDAAFNEFQQQKEKVSYFWIIEKKRLEDKKAELRNKDRELQDLEEKHQVIIKIYKQRVKHLLFEHQNEITGAKTDSEVALKLSQDANRSKEAELKIDRRNLNLDKKEMELSHGDYLKSLKQQQDRNITLLRQEFERKSSELHKNYDKKMKTVREKLELRRKNETSAIEERKNAHIKQLMKDHEQEFSEIKNYYNDITHNNLDLIKSLKDEVAEMKKKEQADEQKMNEIYNENRRMSEPLKKAQKDVEHLNVVLTKYKKEKEDLKKTKARLVVVENQYQSLKWQHQVLQQRYSSVDSERKDLHSKFISTIYEAQQKSGFRNLILEKKLTGMNQIAEQQNASVNEVLSRANLEPSTLGQMKGRITSVLELKNQQSRDLQAELERITSAYQQLVSSASGKMREFGIPQSELGFEPLTAEALVL